MSGLRWSFLVDLFVDVERDMMNSTSSSSVTEVDFVGDTSIVSAHPTCRSIKMLVSSFLVVEGWLTYLVEH